MDGGDLRERVTIRRQVRASDGAGGEQRSWVDGDTVWARVRPSRKGDVSAITEALQQVQGFQVTLRFRRDIAIDDRLVWRGTILNVLSAVDETGGRQWTWVYTDAGVVDK